MNADDLEENQTSSIGKFFHAISYFLLFMIFVAVVLLVQWLCWDWIDNNIPEDKQGAFGDKFGSVNTLFSGLAFAGVLFTIFLQSRELSATRSELKLTRLSHQKTSKIMDKQLEILEKTAAIEESRYLDQFLPEFESDGEKILDRNIESEQSNFQLVCSMEIINTKNAIKDISITTAKNHIGSSLVSFDGFNLVLLPRNKEMKIEYLRVNNKICNLVCDVEFSTMDNKRWECQFIFGSKTQHARLKFEYTPIKQKLGQEI
ncbi:hypothetical protein CA11_53140 [Gimesia maris]|uniref:hypothetical protein n=1 Tax=Gimesia maris TaxID=122 RepID=UPI00118C17ED|nr:hypothetical protein [Gimesia maris]QDU17472.1 hypothetical protein CA11_53140 [Gimesia maris]